MVDLFAGSGALAIEALSRGGAGFALLVDNGAEARALLRANVEALGLGGVTRIWRADATRLGAAPAAARSGSPFSTRRTARASPARRSPRSSAAAGSSRTRSVVVEEAAKAEIAAPPGLAVVDRRIYGEIQIAIFAMPGGG